MDRAKKKRIKKYISWVTAAALVALLALMPLMATTQQEADGPQASILSGTVSTGKIITSLHGGGTLTAQDAVEVNLPSGVKITEFLVSNGDTVSEGDPLAVVDRVSLMSAIIQVQDTLDYLVEEMASVTNEEAATQVKAQAGGLIKQVFAEKGDDVQDVMLEHGALAVLSLDGMMAVNIQRATDLTTGDSVCVILEDDTEITGRVESNMDGTLVITVEDDGYEVGESVVVKTDDGQHLGPGELYVHNAWRAVAYTGTVSYVNAKVGNTAYAGQNLFSLQDTQFNAQLESLAKQHREYENMMLELFKMYQSETINAPCDGLISGVDENSIHLLSTNGENWIIDLLSNAPGSDPDALLDNHVGQIVGVLGSKWIVQMNPTAQNITDYIADMEAVDTSVENMTRYTAMDMLTVYQLIDGQWEIGSAGVGDILLFALSNSGFVWAIHLGSAEVDPFDPTFPSNPDEDNTSPTNPNDPPDTTEPPSGTDGLPELEIPSLDDILGSITGGTAGGYPDSMTGSFGGGVMMPEEENPLFDLEGSTLMSVVPQNEMTLTISLDEQDISKISLGMTAEVKVEALKNQVFTATVTEIGDTGTNSGGSSKFTVELTMKLQENMLAGMTATATIPLSTTENILVIPAEVLVEDGGKTIVYTGYDEKTETLLNPVSVITGRSDGIHVEILSGLNSGDTYWYSYYDTLEIDNSVESPGFGFG